MKVLLITALFVLPFYMNAQTAHIDDGKVVYKGKINTGKADAAAIKTFLEEGKGYVVKELKETDTATIAFATMRLNSPYPVIRKVHYSFSVLPGTNGYSYRIDSVFVTEKQRGGKTKTTSSEDLYKDMEESGLKSQRAEDLLNEIDMRFQKIIALLKNRFGR